MNGLRGVTEGVSGRWLDRAGFALVSTAVLGAGYLQGIQVIDIQLDTVVGAISVAFREATMSVAIFLGFIGFSGLLMLGKQYGAARSDPPTPRDEGSVTAVVPVYGDAPVLHRSVRSLANVAYDDLEVVVVTEPDDDPSRERAEELAAEYDDVTHLVNTRYTGSKAGAINYAAERTDSEYLAAFDADESVHPEFVPGAVGKLREHEVVEGRTVPEPDGFVESIAYYESVLLGYVSQQLLYLVTGFQMASSRATVMRRSVFEDLGGYDPEMLTEDYDFAFRCYKQNVDVVEFLQYPSRIESAHDWRDWWGQRKRWMTGYAQTLHAQLAEVRPIESRRSLLAPLICAGSVGGNVVMLMMVPKFGVLAALGASWGWILPLGLVMALAVALRLADASTEAVDGVDWVWPLMPVVMVLYAFAGVKAILEYVFTWDGSWYTVRKGI